MARDFVRFFEEEVHRPDPAPELLALAIAGLAYSDLDIESQQTEIERIALP